MNLSYQTTLSEGEFEPSHSEFQILADGEFWAYQPPFTIVIRSPQNHSAYVGLNVVGRMEEDSTTSALGCHDLILVASGAGYDFTFVDVGHSGLSSVASDSQRIFFNSSGMIVSAGNPAVGLTGNAVAEGKFDLSFNYNQTDQPAIPSGFKVYEDSSALNLIDTIAYIGGRVRYYHTTSAYPHASSHEFLIRTYRTVAATDYEDKNLNYITLIADSTGPDAITVIRTAH